VREAQQGVGGVERDLGIVGAGLDAEVTAGALRLQLVAGEGGERTQLRRAACPQAEAVLAVALEQAGPEPDRDGQRRGAESESFQAVGRGRAGRVRDVGRGSAGGERRGCLRPGAQQVAQVAGARRGEVERAEAEAPWRGRRDPALVLPVEGHDGRFLRRAGAPGGAKRADQACGTGTRENRAPGEAVIGQPGGRLRAVVRAEQRRRDDKS
jgi:hypothetical protein